MVKKLDLKDKDFELETSWHVAPLFRKDIAMFVGDSQAGKSLTTLYLAVCTAGGRDFLGRSTRQGHVVCVNNEHSMEYFHSRWIEKYCLGLGLNLSTLPLTCFSYEYMDLTNSSLVKELLSRCTQLDTVLLTIDNLGSSIGGQNENHTHIVQRVMDNLGMFRDKDMMVLPTHHYKKNEKIYRGSTVSHNLVDREFALEPRGYRTRQARDEDGELRWLDPDTPLMEDVLESLSIVCTKSRDAKPEPLLVRIEENDKTGAARLVVGGRFELVDEVAEAEKDIIDFCRLNSGEGFTLKRIDEGVIGNWHISIMREALNNLLGKKILEKRPYGKQIRAFEVGVEATAAQVPKSFVEEMDEIVFSLCQQHEGEGWVRAGDLFINALVQQLPKFAAIVDPKDEKMIGPSKRVGQSLH